MGYELRDAQLKVTRALPNGAATVNSSGIDLGHSTRGDVPGNFEVVVMAPAVTTGMLGDAATIKYSIEHDTDPAFGSATLLMGDVLVQTGASGAGAAAAEARVRLPSNAKRYIRTKVVKSAAGDASSVSATMEIRA